MGNTESGSLETTEKFKDHLAILEEKIHSIEASHHYHYAWPDGENDLVIDGAPIQCRKSIRILLGPVIGRVTHETVIILLEVNQDIEITCNLSLVDKHCPEGRLFQKKIEPFVKNCPRTFYFDNLIPGRRYTVSFSGVNKEDAKERTGRFQTYDIHDPSLHILFVSEDNPNNILRGEKNLWENIYNEVMDENHPAHLVLHLGGQINLESSFESLWIMIRRHVHSAYKSHLMEKGWQYIEDQIFQSLKDVYLFQWNIPRIQKILANTSNLMIWNDHEVYSKFTFLPQFYVDHDQVTLEMHAARILIRSARKLYVQYQRQLWDLNSMKMEDDEKKAIYYGNRSLKISERVISLQEECVKTEEAMMKARKRADYEAAKRFDVQLETKRKEREDLIIEREALHADFMDKRGEEFYHHVGKIGFLFLDMRGNRIYGDGSQAADNLLFNEIQWEFFDQVLSDKEINVLILCSEFPLVDEEHSKIEQLIESSYVYEDLRAWWGSNQDAQVKWLSKISDWKLFKPGREVVFLSGSIGQGLGSGSTIITDTELRVSYSQYMVGPITASVKSRRDFFIPSTQGIIQNQYDYKHEWIPQERNFGILDIKNIDTVRPVLNVQFIHQFYIETTVTLGPIIGMVTSTTARILLEIDEDNVPVMCILQNDILQKEQHRCVRIFRQKRPSCFYFTRLKPDQQYKVSFVGIKDPLTYQGSFHTPSKNPEKFHILAVCRDQISDHILHKSDEIEKDSKELWPAICQAVATPFSSVNLVVHLGGQINIEGSSSFQESLSILHGLETPVSLDNEDIIEKAKHSIRGIYRHQWNLPNTREALANGSHLMIWNEMDMLNGFVSSTGSAVNGIPAGKQLIRILRSVFHEYQRILWDNEVTELLQRKFEKNIEEVCLSEHICQQWGSFGIFMMDVYGNRLFNNGNIALNNPLISSSQKNDLKRFLISPNLQTLILASPIPFVDNSIDDALVKALYDDDIKESFPYYKEDLLEILSILFQWKKNGINREVILLCGSSACGIETVITDHTYNNTIFQKVVGPINGPCYAVDMETQGALTKDWSYEHMNELYAHQFGSIILSKQSNNSISIEYKKIVEENSFINSENIQNAVQWKISIPETPSWLFKLHHGKDVQQEQEENEMIKTFVSNFIESEEQEKLSCCFKSIELFPGEQEICFSLAHRIYPAIHNYYEVANEELKKNCFMPSLYLTMYILHRNKHDEKKIVSYGVLDFESFKEICNDIFQEGLLLIHREAVDYEKQKKERRIKWNPSLKEKEEINKVQVLPKEESVVESEKPEKSMEKVEEKKEETDFSQE